MINTHEKLIETVLEKQVSKEMLFNILKDYGYKGAEKDVIADMLGAMSYTTAYMSSEELTEEEYFETLIKEMNLNY